MTRPDHALEQGSTEPSIEQNKLDESKDEMEFSARYPGLSVCIYRTLKERARKKDWIGYEELNQACGLGLDLRTDQGRTRVGELAGAVSEFEVNKHRPMLSAVLVHKQSPREPGPGFYKWADKLGQRKPGESDKVLWFRLLNECHTYWSQRRQT
jgi:hypothetical protein